MMKTRATKTSWQLGILLLAALLSGVLIPPASRVAAAENEAPAPSGAPEPGEFANSFTFGIGSFFVDGDPAQFQYRLQQPDGTVGGIEEIHFEQFFGDQNLFELDARGLFYNSDYGVELGVSNPDVGYLRGGYQTFRTWYDGSGGYTVRSNAWISLYDEELFVDRSVAWIEGGLTLPDWPEFRVRYAYETREGMKDSTIWGDYSLTLNTANLRGIVPTYLGIDEHRHIVDTDMKQSFSNFTYGVGMRYEHDDLENTRNITRRPLDPARVRTVTQTDDMTADIFNFHGYAEMRLSPKVLFTTGYAYTWLDTDVGGSRLYGPATPGGPLNPQSNDEGFYDLAGGSRVDQYVANFNFMITPWQHVTIVPSVRVEHQEQNGTVMFVETRVTNSAAPPAMEDIVNSRVRRFTDVAEGLELRYTGITNWSLYARGEWVQGQGTLKEDEFDVIDPDPSFPQVRTNIQRVTESERFVQKYSIGANWYPCRQANFAAQYYFRSRQNDYDHLVDTASFNRPFTNDLYPAFINSQQFDTHDVNFRVTLRPAANVTLVSRYDFQVTTYSMSGTTNTFGALSAEVDSAETVAHIFSQSVSWSPVPRLFLQGSLTYALDSTENPAADLTGALLNVVQDAENDYWNASLTAGYALNRISDLQVNYSYYRADNYVDNSSVSLPYGAGAEEHGVTVTLVNRLKRNVLWKIQYGYFSGESETSGGNNDYDAHLVYSSLTYLF